MATTLDAMTHQLRIVRDREHELQVALDTLADLIHQAGDEQTAVDDYQAGMRSLRAVRDSL